MALKECGVMHQHIIETSVPGSFELPYAANLLALTNSVDVILCIGVLIKGETVHFEYISESVSKGLLDVSLKTKIPCVFGVLTCLNEQQVIDRSSSSLGSYYTTEDKETNQGYHWGNTAVEMALLKRDAFGESGHPRSKMGFGHDVHLTTTGKNNEKERNRITHSTTPGQKINFQG